MADDFKQAVDDGAKASKAATDRAANAAKGAADTMRETTEKARDAFSEKVVDPARRAGEAMTETGGKIAEGGATIGKTMIDQAEQNAREAFAAMREAASAKDLTQVMKIQGDYLREQSQRSMSQAREISELIMKFGKDAVAPLRGDGPK
ncbi:phasin family protein [Sphingomonas sp. UV9]|uniref:phasin family protein n=1 Tax=Sphingomonas sp. UV9 TaxID=1851410 RepID=UPI000FFB3A43|nr:phasin family protein [Sphingomonas sp. UV9]RXD05330.1 phasin family protein [Sphingomonas sp. UV9]